MPFFFFLILFSWNNRELLNKINGTRNNKESREKKRSLSHKRKPQRGESGLKLTPKNLLSWPHLVNLEAAKTRSVCIEIYSYFFCKYISRILTSSKGGELSNRKGKSRYMGPRRVEKRKTNYFTQDISSFSWLGSK